MASFRRRAPAPLDELVGRLTRTTKSCASAAPPAPVIHPGVTVHPAIVAAPSATAVVATATPTRARAVAHSHAAGHLRQSTTSAKRLAPVRPLAITVTRSPPMYQSRSSQPVPSCARSDSPDYRAGRSGSVTLPPGASRRRSGCRPGGSPAAPAPSRCPYARGTAGGSDTRRGSPPGWASRR